MTEVIQLREDDCVARGKHRLVYRHPDNSGYLIKVMAPEFVKEKFGSNAKLVNRRRRLGQYTNFMREISEYLGEYARHSRSRSFLQKIIGLVETNLGLGLVSEVVWGPDGKMAPTLSDMIRQGQFNDQVRSDLEKLFNKILESDVILSDMNTGNYVYGVDEDGSRKFVVIDGIGQAHFLPMSSWVKWLNRYNKKKRMLKNWSRIEKEIVKYAS